MATTLIKGGTIVNYNSTQKADILIENEQIIKIEPQIEGSFDLIINASDKFIFPGGIDPHVHFHLPTPAGYSCDNFESGSKAAVAGGTTTIIDFVTPKKNESLLHALEQRKLEAESCCCDYAFHVSPITWNEQVKSDMEICVNQLGISSFKIYMAYLDSIGVNNTALEKIMQHVAKLGATLAIHAEDGKVVDNLRADFVAQGKLTPKYHALSRPAAIEAQAVNTAIELAKVHKTKLYFVHISAAESVARIKKAQQEGFPIFAETCPQYLLFDNSKLSDDFYRSAPYVFSPALHGPEHKIALWQAIEDGIIQSIGTDHCPFNLKGQKDLGKHDFTKIANGTGGVEHRLELLYNFGVLQHKISMEKMVDVMATKPAQIFGIANKGIIKEGFDADIVIWDPTPERTISAKTHFQNCDTNIYEGLAIKGGVESVFIRGNIVFNKNKHLPFKGKLISRI